MVVRRRAAALVLSAVALLCATTGRRGLFVPASAPLPAPLGMRPAGPANSRAVAGAVDWAQRLGEIKSVKEKERVDISDL